MPVGGLIGNGLKALSQITKAPSVISWTETLGTALNSSDALTSSKIASTAATSELMQRELSEYPNDYFNG